MSKSTTFRSVSYGPCSSTGITCVASVANNVCEMNIANANSHLTEIFIF